MAAPRPLDFAELAGAVRRNNMGLGGFRLWAAAAVQGDRVRLEPTGQTFRWVGPPPAGGGPARVWMRVLDGEVPTRTALEIDPSAPIAGVPAAPAAN